ncbi:hypothetical protein VOLCADRAFT_104872 [Volvox carteri f. nagariensis]|uniref:CHRD domain-containing protein n=1 Tax=Volvox carteri f. nagariensis TaxID=3068 RepID=D8TWN3_VOLCA|nr:uncharacterized protein VOLCADRAFT_104872 [Volvox carteri f. nagariensis]EFJ48178.1 hypothetical protein VOLCADRAFT_104872 [Volvox carteri f. nagariensis]|eukprot:XP_002950863.1 hypothetical protein VOLCADRAFT_104872 [Volvox carteri f. nagariensis]
MDKYACLLSFVVLLLSFGHSTRAEPRSPTGSWPNAPFGSIVAAARLLPVDKSLVVHGSAAVVWPRERDGPGYVTINMTGTLNQMTMAHIHLNATGKPIRLDLLPVLNGTRPMPLNPPLSFRGIVSFTAPLTYTRAAAWDPNNSGMGFLDALQQGLLYVNVHSVGFPAGAVQGKLVCKDPCMFPLCSGSSGHPC